MMPTLMLLLLRALLLAAAVLISIRVDTDWDRLMTYAETTDRVLQSLPTRKDEE